MKTIFSLILLLTMTCTLSAQSSIDNQIQEDLSILKDGFTDFFGELFEIVEQKDSILTKYQISKSDDKGSIVVDGDTLNVTSLFSQLSDGLKLLPGTLRPNENYIEGLDSTAVRLPDLLMQSQSLFKDLDVKEFEQLFNFSVPDTKQQQVAPVEEPKQYPVYTL